MRSSIVILALVALGCVGMALGGRVSFHGAVPAGWQRLQRVAPTHNIHLTFALKQQNVDKLEEVFWAVSDPTSSEYGRHLSVNDVQSIVAPAPDTIAAVQTWLKSHGVAAKQEASSDYLSARVESSLAEEMLDCEFYYFSHSQVGASLRIIRADGNYSLPVEVANHVDFVGGVSHFPSVKPMLQRRAMIQNAKKRVEDAVLDGNTDLWSLAVDPAFLRELYNIGSVQGKSSANRMAVAQFLEQYYSSLDLDEFFLLFWRNSIGQQPTVVGPNPSPAGTEASLDIEYIMSIGSQINTTFWSTSGRENNQEPFLQWMLAVNQLANPPYVFSVSYGDDEDTIPLSYTTRLNTEFMKAGARGISILFASGDDGVGGGGGSKCKKFVPNYPASSPYITAVGGTQSDGVFESGGEIVASLSGGGFSNYFGRPTYQAAAVENYLTEMKAKLPPQAKWNATGRAYPDVSAQAMDYVIVINLIPLPGVAGTSCACPVFSGVVSLLNDFRLQNGKRPLGFLNPMLYQMASSAPTTFNDIVHGSNPACGSAGFLAAKGWDPSSGLGSPNYGEMAKYIATLP